MLYEIRHRFTDTVLFSLECGSLKLCVEAAVKSRADLSDADLSGANLRVADLSRADLSDADLSRADIIDGGQDARGFRFWCWRDKDGSIVYCAGCHTWTDIAEALAYYGESYPSTGDCDECVARLLLMQRFAEKQWPRVAQEVAA